MFHIDISLGFSAIICGMHLKYIIHNMFTLNSQIIHKSIQVRRLDIL